MKEIDFNLNDYVKVKINERGLKILEQRHKYYFEMVPQIGEFKPPEKDAEGWSKFQLWVLMESFGEHIHIGMDGPIETAIKLITA